MNRMLCDAICKKMLRKPSSGLDLIFNFSNAKIYSMISTSLDYIIRRMKTVTSERKMRNK